MNLLEHPTSGNVYFREAEITNPKANISKIRQELVMVFQHFNLFPHMTVLENVTYAPIKVKGLNKESAINKGLELLDKVGLAEKANIYPARLSGNNELRSHALWQWNQR